MAPIYDSGSSLGYDKVAAEIRFSRNIVCKPFKNHHEEQLKLVSDFSWIRFEELSDVRDLIINTLSSDDAKDYIDETRIAAIADSVEHRIAHLKEIADSHITAQTISTDDDVAENVAANYLPKQ